MAKRKNIRGRISLADAASLASRRPLGRAMCKAGIVVRAILIARLFYALAGCVVNRDQAHGASAESS
jgi:hypothetical protein